MNGGSCLQSVEIEAASQVCAVEFHFVEACVLTFIYETCHPLTHGVVNCERYG